MRSWGSPLNSPGHKLYISLLIPSNHSATVTTLLRYDNVTLIPLVLGAKADWGLRYRIYTLLYAIISIFDLIVKFVKKNINNLFKKAIYKTRYKYFRSGIIYVQNWRVCELLKCILAIQKQLTNRPQVITNQTDHRWTFVTVERPWNISI